jgi:LacI family transcriptional regulator
MPVTMLDIARDLDVSVVTVSKVLRNQGRISEATRKRVLLRAKQLNYQMNWVARSLVMRRTFTIGLVLPEFTHSFFAEVARAVAETVRPGGYHVVMSCFEEDPELEVSVTDSMLARQVDGLIVASVQARQSRAIFKQIEQRNVPYVLIDRPISGLKACFVGVDNQAIGRMATEHLIASGCQRIAHLRGPDIDIAEDRMAGYREALAKRGRRGEVAEGGHRDDSGYEGMQRLLNLRPRPDGVFCFNDPVAIGAMRAVLQAGLRLPQDIAMAGSGNIHYSDVLAVPLTTIDQGSRRTGVKAAELLMARIGAERPVRPEKILIPPELVERQSTRSTR